MSEIQRKYEKIIRDYEKHCRRIEQSTYIDISESPQEKLKRKKQLERDYITWFEYYFPMYAKSKSAWFHKRMANILIKNPVVNLLAEIYRSGAKSVHLDMGIPLYLYFTGELHFMLLVGETEPKAKRLISDIQGQLQYNQRLINDYGKRFKYGDWSDGDFTTSDDAKFLAIGIGQNPRGAREGAERPDYIVVDDVDSKKRVKNDRLSREAHDWVWEDLKGTFDEGATRARFVVANNNFHKNTIINQLKVTFKLNAKKARERGQNSKYYVLTVKAVKDLTSFEPNWPEKTSAAYWKQKFEDFPYRSFMREYMHTHIQDGAIFKPEHIRYKKRLQLRQYDALVFYGDLSYKDKGDYKAMLLVGKAGREFHILKAFVRQSSRADVAYWLYNVYEDLNLKKYPVRYWIEGLFAQDEFVNDFDLEGDNRGYYIPVVADKDPKGNKFDRIESMVGYFERGNVYFDLNIKDSEDTQTLIDQLLAFEKGSGANDDGPDALQSAIAKLNEATYVGKFDVRLSRRKDVINRSKNRF